MDSRDISVVLQGALIPSEYAFYKDNIAKIRAVLPNSKIILSTWEGTFISSELDVDLVVFSKDPGGLIGIKRCDINKANNINRQIITTYSGLEKVKTEYVLKIRTDCYLEHSNFTEYFIRFSKSKDYIISTSFFTIDPTMYEHMPYHISDWFQFGKTNILLQYWDVPLMTEEDSSWYLSHKYASNSGFFDKEFISKFAVEQYIAINYAKKLGYEIPEFHNDNRKIVLESYYKFLSERIIILDLCQAGLVFPKYLWVYSSVFFSMSCITFTDWYGNYINNMGISVGKDDPVFSSYLKRKKKKYILRILINLIEPVSSYWYPSRLRGVLFKLAKRLSKVLKVFKNKV
ncbi:WavE lipopolysaccharide synthesis family protein [Haemophilus haemolyticus]|uniref:WavE lipopolysaccharide synthesis family protein n=1 Tax=Haemophilus haemolyticus TaxID=726 RepID=UPI000E0D165F|nr:WavE lipopolysaccharide synthesis family protein [Haemophilus haemolyticus]